MNMLIIKNIKLLVVHCSDTKDSNNLSALDIHEMHLKFGWDGIGYHKIINRSGKVENGRPEYWIGAHVKGKNRSSIGVCYIGGMDRNMKNWIDTRTEAQKKSLIELIKDLQKKYPGSIVYGHRDFTSKKPCPSFDAKNEYK